MSRKNWLAMGIITGTVAGGAAWRGSRNHVAEEAAHSPADARHLLERAVSLVRLPTSPDSRAEVLPDSSSLGCPVTGQIYPYRDGVLDLLAGAVPLTATH